MPTSSINGSRHPQANKVRWARPAIDAAMAVVYLLQMAPYQTGGLYHELAGLTFMVLFLTHHALNAGWLRRAQKARGASTRINAALDLLMIVCISGIAISGILMSKDALPALSRPELAHVMRPLHACLTYAGLILVSLHVGMHAPILRGYMRLRGKEAEGHRQWTSHLIVALCLVAGVAAFKRLDVWTKLTRGMTFPDGMTPLPVLILWHVALAAPFVVCGALLSKALRRR